MTSAELLLSLHNNLHDELLFIMNKSFRVEGGIVNAVWPFFFLISVEMISKLFLISRRTHWCILLQMVLLN